MQEEIERLWRLVKLNEQIKELQEIAKKYEKELEFESDCLMEFGTLGEKENRYGSR